MEPGDVAAQVVEPVAADLVPGRVQLDAVELLHDVRVVGDGIVGHQGLPEALDLHVLGVVLADGHGGVDDLGDHQHALADLPLELHLTLVQGGHLVSHGGDLLLGGLRLVPLALAHEHADPLADHVPLVAEVVAAGHRLPILLIEGDHLVHQGELLVLKLLLDVLPDQVGVRAQQLDVDHMFTSFPGPGCPADSIRLLWFAAPRR